MIRQNLSATFLRGDNDDGRRGHIPMEFVGCASRQRNHDTEVLNEPRPQPDMPTHRLRMVEAVESSFIPR